MDPLERFHIIDTIGRVLQEQYSTRDINTILIGYGIPNNGTSIASSKWIYVKDLLSSIGDETILQIAHDLKLPVPNTVNNGSIKLAELLDGTAFIHAKNDFDEAIQALESHPNIAIGLASTTLESIYKSILDSFNTSYPDDESLQPLQKAVFEKMELSLDGQADPEIKRILGGLINVGAGIGTLRTRYSSFHGKGEKQYRLEKRHALLAINSMSTIGLFLIQTYQEKYRNNRMPSS